MAGNPQIASKMNLDDWSVREKLVLACCVVRSGDQNWASVSRTIKPICEAVESRPSEWFSQKSCANQYSSLLEGTSTKKRKRTSSDSGANETPMEQIIRKLSFERIDELKKAIQADRKRYKKLKCDIEKIRSGKMDDLLQKIWNDLQSSKHIPIEAVIHEDIPEFQLSMGPQFSDVQNVAMVTSSVQAFHQQQQQQSSPLYQRSKSQRQPKATKKFESWMTQLKQQQARHQQSHSGSVHASPHGQPPSSHSSSDMPPQTDPTGSPGIRPQTFYQHQFPHQSPYHVQQLQQQQQQQQEQYHQEQQQQHQNKQFQQQQQQQGYPQTPSRTHASIELSASANVNESGSVLSSLLIAPTYEIKAAAALQQQKIKEEHLASKDTASASDMKSASGTTGHQHAVSGSVFSAAPTLSKLLESPAKMQSNQRQGSVSSIDGQQETETKPGHRRDSLQSDGASVSQLQSISFSSVSPSSQNKTSDSSPPSDRTSKKSTPESSRTTPIEPLRIKVEDEDYFPDNEGVATPDSSQPSPKSKIRRTKGKRGFKRKQPQHILLKNFESLQQDSEDTCSVDELASERDETESEVASVSDAKEMSDMEQDDGEDGAYAKMAEDAREHSNLRRSRGRTSSSNLSGGMVLSPNSPTLSVGSNEENSQAQKNWRKSIMLVWKSIASHKYANVFMHPVTDDEAPGYRSIVKRPMDLSTIKKNIETGGIRCTSGFRRDVMLMFQNALMYNREDHDVHRMAEEMREEVMEQIQSFIATQLHLLVQSSDRDTMMLRGHRSDDEKVELRRSKTHGRSSHKV